MERSIEDWCLKLGLENYEIVMDGLVNINGDINLANKNLSTFPIFFGIVNGSFYCYQNIITSLQGSPIKLGGHFNCRTNQLTSLKGSTKIINGYFDCGVNLLTSLEDSPSNVNLTFFCGNNKLTSLEGRPKRVGIRLDCENNPIYQVYKLFDSLERYEASLDYGYWKGLNIKRRRFEMACKDAEIKMPDSIPGYEYI
jgi:hypothetical protein